MTEDANALATSPLFEADDQEMFDDDNDQMLVDALDNVLATPSPPIEAVGDPVMSAEEELVFAARISSRMTLDNMTDMTMDNFGDSFLSIDLPYTYVDPHRVNAAHSFEASHPDDESLFPEGPRPVYPPFFELGSVPNVRESDPSDDSPTIHMTVADDALQVVHVDDQLPNQVEEGLGDVDHGELRDQPPPHPSQKKHCYCW